MEIYSPSYKRSDGVKTHLIIPEITYCVHEFEKDKYLNQGYKIEVLPDSLRGNIARVRNHIKNEIMGKSGLIIDDDIEGIKRWTTDKNGKFKAVDVEVNEFIENGFIMCKEVGAKLWGVNILSDKGSYREYTPISLTNTISGSFMGFVDNELDFDERIPLKEDYDYCLQNLNQYRRLLRLNFNYLVKKDHKNKGGCADYRTIQIEKEQMQIFQKKWGSDIVRVDEKGRGNGYDINPIIKVPIKGV